MVRGKPIVLLDGGYLLPMYHETGDDRETPCRIFTSYFLRYHPQTKTWTETNRMRSPHGNLQPQAVQIDEQHHPAASPRCGRRIGPATSGHILCANLTTAGIIGAMLRYSQSTVNSAVDVEKLKNGHIVLAYNDSLDL